MIQFSKVKWKDWTGKSFVGGKKITIKTELITLAYFERMTK